MWAGRGVGYLSAHRDAGGAAEAQLAVLEHGARRALAWQELAWEGLGLGLGLGLRLGLGLGLVKQRGDLRRVVECEPVDLRHATPHLIVEAPHGQQQPEGDAAHL